MAYIFTTRHLSVRRFRREDLSAFRAVMRDAESQRFLSCSSLVISKAAARRLLEETIVAYDSPEHRLAYAVELCTPVLREGSDGREPGEPPEPPWCQRLPARSRPCGREPA